LSKLSKLVVVQHPPPSHYVDHTFLFQITERDVLNYFQLPGNMKALHCPHSLCYDVDGRKMTERSNCPVTFSSSEVLLSTLDNTSDKHEPRNFCKSNRKHSSLLMTYALKVKHNQSTVHSIMSG